LTREVVYIFHESGRLRLKLRQRGIGKAIRATTPKTGKLPPVATTAEPLNSKKQSGLKQDLHKATMPLSNQKTTQQ
jgi:hypothetical protein